MSILWHHSFELEPKNGLEQEDLSGRIDIAQCHELGRASALELAHHATSMSHCSPRFGSPKSEWHA